MFPSTFTDPLSEADIQLIEGSGLTTEELSDFWGRYPDQSFEAAIGGALEEKGIHAEGKKTMGDVLENEEPETPESEM